MGIDKRKSKTTEKRSSVDYWTLCANGAQLN